MKYLLNRRALCTASNVRRIFDSDLKWTVVRGSGLEEGESQGFPVRSRRVGDPILNSNLTLRIYFALFMFSALENDELIHEAPAIVGCQSPSALEQTINNKSTKISTKRESQNTLTEYI